MMLSDVDIKRLIENIGLIEDYTDIGVQLQQCGFDLTLDYVERIPPTADPLIVDFTNDLRTMPQSQKYSPWVKKDMLKFLDGPTNRYVKHIMNEANEDSKWFYISRGSDVVFHSKEKVKMPVDLCAQGKLRSTLQRATMTYTSAIADPGFYGHLTFSVHAGHDLLIMKGARFCQVVFIKLTTPAKRLYTGIYSEALVCPKCGTKEEWRKTPVGRKETIRRHEGKAQCKVCGAWFDIG